MDTHAAVAALRTLDALPEARRRYLSVLTTTAPTDADRARIVMMARRENIDQRWTAEQALKAELDNRRKWASRNPLKPVEAPQKASKRMERTDETTPAHRPVVVTWTTPTKTAKVKPVRAEGIGPSRTTTPQTEKPKPTKPEPKPRTPRPIPEHGTLTRYQNPHACRCEQCRAVKSRSNAAYKARLAVRSGKTGH